ncbi:hypothetical protein Dimus_005236, partial [Dionaea muscipula]
MMACDGVEGNGFNRREKDGGWRCQVVFNGGSRRWSSMAAPAMVFNGSRRWSSMAVGDVFNGSRSWEVSNGGRLSSLAGLATTRCSAAVVMGLRLL